MTPAKRTPAQVSGGVYDPPEGGCQCGYSASRCAMSACPPDVKPRILAFTGPAGSGKSAALREARLVLGRPAITVKFSGPLKAMLRAFYREVGLGDAEIERRIEGDLKEAPCPHLGGKTPRYAMQTLGTEWGRQMIADDFWVAAFAARAELETQQGRTVLTDDCRFENEAAAVRAMGGEIIHVHRPHWMRERAASAHVSERGISHPDRAINNDGDEEHLRREVRTVLCG